MLNQFFLLKIHARRFLALCTLATVLIALGGWLWRPALWLCVPLGVVLAIGLADLLQTHNSIVRNFPVLGHLRYQLRDIAPELHQYFVENDTDGKPFDKTQRDLVDKRAELENDTHPFGTEREIGAVDYEWVPHSIYPKPALEQHPRITIGGRACTQPYAAAIFNISAMSYGSLSAAAVRALNKGASLGGFFHDTGEGGLTPYHLEFGADLAWEIGSGYFGCRTPDGRFDPEAFAEKARLPQVKLIEIKLSQGAKPGHGGVLPAAKNTPEIARIRGVEPYTKVVSPAYHREFADAPGLLGFVQRLRELSGGKPVGFKLCVGKLDELRDVCRAMHATGIRPDFITVDGSEGGTGAAPIEFSDSVGMPLERGLVALTDHLDGFDLRDEIRVLASGKVISGFDIVRCLALGADACNSARGMMFALGCIQALKCDTNECPTGITTHDPALTRGLVVADKARRVANFQRETVRAALELLAAMGLDDLDALGREHILKRISPHVIRSFAELYPPVRRGSYLTAVDRPLAAV